MDGFAYAIFAGGTMLRLCTLCLLLVGCTHSNDLKQVSADLLGIQAGAALQVFNVNSAPFLARGDGATDDREAIQKAIDAARDAGGGDVLLPAGTYRVTLAPSIEGETALKRAFTVYPNVQVRGESRDSSILKLAGGQGGYGSLFAGKTFGADVSGFSLRSLTVDHNTRENSVNTLEDVKLDDANFARSNIRAAVYVLREVLPGLRLLLGRAHEVLDVVEVDAGEVCTPGRHGLAEITKWTVLAC